MKKLHVVEGPLRGKTFDVQDRSTIGRQGRADIQLDGKHISRVHARLEKREDDFYIRDNGSRNGIYVNGRRVDESVLREDDEIEIGEHVLVFQPSADPAKRSRASTTVLDSILDPFKSEGRDDRFVEIPAIASQLIGTGDEMGVAKGLLDELMNAIKSDRGFIMVTDKTGGLKPAARKVPSQDDEFFLSNVLSYQVTKERRSIVAMDVLRKEPNAGKRIAILCAPVGTVGLAYLERKMDEKDGKPEFSIADLRFAGALSSFAGSRIEQIRTRKKSSRIGEKPLPALVKQFEKECLVEAVQKSKGDLTLAAKMLHIQQKELDDRLKALGVKLEEKQGEEKQTKAAWKSVVTQDPGEKK